MDIQKVASLVKNKFMTGQEIMTAMGYKGKHKPQKYTSRLKIEPLANFKRGRGYTVLYDRSTALKAIAEWRRANNLAKEAQEKRLYIRKTPVQKVKAKADDRLSRIEGKLDQLLAMWEDKR